MRLPSGSRLLDLIKEKVSHFLFFADFHDEGSILLPALFRHFHAFKAHDRILAKTVFFFVTDGCETGKMGFDV